MPTTILGIRHHGVGSALRVKEELERLKPDLVLVEGPPELDDLLPLASKEGFKPPVAIMLYNVANPNQSTFYPYAEYSPEWVAIQYALSASVLVRAMDLPAKINFNQKLIKIIEQEKSVTEDATQSGVAEEEINPELQKVGRDPMSYLASIAGYDDSEQWWEYQFEKSDTQESASDHFEAVMLAMSALREEDIPSPLDHENVLREAYMREIIRKAQLEMYDNIVVVCGAWHAPALVDVDGQAKSDAKLIKATPKGKVKINASWIPWTNSRLSMFSGYGAGIMSPGWSEHNWICKSNVELEWLTKVATLFREEGRDISTAHVLESYKLATALSSLRNKSLLSLEELSESILTVMCMGDPIYMDLIKRKLIVGDRLGEVPDDIPKVPLQQDFEKTAKTLRLKFDEIPKEMHLDLRKPMDLKRSVFFHRIELLGIPWAERTIARTKGTFKEGWTLEWEPEMIIALIDKSYLGNTVKDAVIADLQERCAKTNKISEISGLVNVAIAAELQDSIDLLLGRIDELSSISSDIIDLMTAMPDLVNLARYGDVRKSDLQLVDTIVQRFFTKIFIGLPPACFGLDEESSIELFELISKMNNVIKVYDDEAIALNWHSTLMVILEKAGIHDIIQGCTCRLLLDAEVLDKEDSVRRISYALSLSRDPHHVASWVEGFLKGNGMILIYDNRLWNLLYEWITSLEKETFNTLLPYLRRAFSKFQHGERKQIGQKAKKGIVKIDEVQVASQDDNWNEEAALRAFPTLDLLMGITPES